MMQPASLAAARMLVVDDAHANVVLLERMLRHNGYTNVRTLTDPRDALPTYVTWEPDMVLLDLQMPHLDGYTVLQQFAAMPNALYVPVLVLTADITPHAKQRALALGAKDFLAKPFDMAEVMLRIKNLLEMRFLYLHLQQHSGNLERQVHDRTRALEAAQFEIVERLARAAEYRDDATGGHIRRVGELSAQLAQAYGLGSTDVALIRYAAPLHDIGKLGIPDQILLKPGRLTEAERAQMCTHTTIGAQLLTQSSSRLTQVAEQIALTHHERWDGAGYPHGLHGDQIPLVGRIVAIADVFDALTSMRPYKPAWSVEHALAEIERQRGHQFDPHLVDLFLHEHQRSQPNVVHKLPSLDQTRLLPELHEREPSPP
jgi:putative two-component system response regulator